MAAAESDLKRKRQSDTGTGPGSVLNGYKIGRGDGPSDAPRIDHGVMSAHNNEATQLEAVTATIDSTHVLQHSSEHERREKNPSDDGHGSDEAASYDDSDDSSLLEGALDQIELDPYQPEPQSEFAIEPDAAALLRKRLREVGLQQFFDENQHIAHRQLGVAFGIDPTLEVPEELYLQILYRVLMREYMRRQKLEHVNTIDDAARLLGESKKIIVITGAGISTSLGIPDFRSKGTGFYDKIRSMGFEGGEDVFDIEMFDQDPSVFYSLAGDILPDQKRFTPTHAFLRLLQDQDRLQTNYTQNIDNLEALAGVSKDKLIQCHGSFATATCRLCKHQVPGEDIFPQIRAGQVAQCEQCIRRLTAKETPGEPQPHGKSAKPRRPDFDDLSSDDEDDDLPGPGIMKPDITFFGEQLPSLFFDRFSDVDAAATDLVVVIGTSLKVAPVSDMCNHISGEVPQIYISREPVEHHHFDVQLLGDCDAVVWELCRRAGWSLEHEMVPRGMEVDVEPVEGYASRWKVVQKGRGDDEGDGRGGGDDGDGVGKDPAGADDVGTSKDG